MAGCWQQVGWHSFTDHVPANSRMFDHACSVNVTQGVLKFHPVQSGLTLERGIDISQAYTAQLRFQAEFSAGSMTANDIVHVEGSNDGSSWTFLLELRGSWALGAMTIVDLTGVRSPSTAFRFRAISAGTKLELEYVTVVLQVKRCCGIT